MSHSDHDPEQTRASRPQLLERLPFRMHDRELHGQYMKAPASQFANNHHRDPRTKQYPESLVLHGGARVRSPTESSMSTLSSAPDSATTCPLSALGSPFSSSYASDYHEYRDIIAGSRPASRVHRHKPSDGTCSTFVNDDEDATYFAVAPYCPEKNSAHPDGAMPAAEIVHQSRPQSPSTAAFLPIKQEADETHLTFYDESAPSTSPEPATTPLAEEPEQWETESAASDLSSPEDTDAVLDYTLQVAYGIDLGESSVNLNEARQIAQKFVRQLGQLMYQAGTDGQGPKSTSMWNREHSTPGNSGESQRGGKRKKQQGSGRGDDETEDLSEGEGDGYAQVKKSKPNPRDDENMRLSCPFRKRNPNRFNVRDHHSCAMTYFPKFAELRQHIVKQHKRDDPSAFVCDRCNRDFTTRKELRDHQRLPREQICDISDHDPEAGIDGPTSVKLLSRKRASGTSPEVQWREVWNILFPDDDDGNVPTYQFTPVIEHFEISDSYQTAFEYLRQSLSGMFENPATLDTLATKFNQCFLETVQQCVAEAQRMPYTNRSNKRVEQLAATAPIVMQPRKPIVTPSRPDSGVVLNDDGSDESGSVMGLAHKNSMRTVQSSMRNGNFSSTSNTGMATARCPSAIFEPMAFSIPPSTSATPVPVAPSSLGQADVQAWTQDVMLPFQPVSHDFGIAPDVMHVSHNMNWQHSFLDVDEHQNGMPNAQPGFM